METKHRQKVKVLLSTIRNTKFLWQLLNQALQDRNAPVYCYVMLCQEIVVGVAVILEEFNYNYLRTRYDLYPVSAKFYKSGTQGVVDNIVVSPIFQRYSSFFLRELHRLSQFDVLYYKLKPSENCAAYRYRPLNNLLGRFLPIMPIRQPNCDYQSLISQGKILNQRLPNVFVSCVITLNF